jgi:hypothetical protein
MDVNDDAGSLNARVIHSTRRFRPSGYWSERVDRRALNRALSGTYLGTLEPPRGATTR